MNEKAPWSWTRTADEEMNLILVGETNVNRPVPEEAFANVMSTLTSADVLFGHLECPLTTPSDNPDILDIPYKPLWKFSERNMVKACSAAGFAAVGCASNVMYGARAVQDTISALNEEGIAYCGIGMNNKEARKPAIVERNGVKFGFLSYTSIFWPNFMEAGPATPGVATARAHTSYQPGRRAQEMPGASPIVKTVPDDEDLLAIENDIKTLREQVDIIVASFHWGVSSDSHTFEYQKIYAHAAIKAGADIIMGHGSHLVQGIEVYKGKPVFYSLGNFAFDWKKMINRHLDSILVRCSINNKKLLSVSFVPAKRNEDNLITLLEPSQGDGKKIFDGVVLMSSEYNTKFSAGTSEIFLQGIE